MNGMRFPPLLARGENQDSQPETKAPVGARGRQKGVMAAVVEEYEDADHEPSGRDRQQQRQPVANLQTEVHGNPAGHVQQQRDNQLAYRGLRFCFGERLHYTF